jgi:hypothetical protein
MGALAARAVLAGGVVAVVAIAPGSALDFDMGWGGRAATPRAQPRDAPPSASRVVPVQADPRVRAFLQAYDALIDSVAPADDDVVFYLGGRAIHFQDGRMLDPDRAANDDECDPIFYRYPLGSLTEPPVAPDEPPRYCTDVLEALWGSTESEIRRHGSSVTFLDHRMFVNDLLIEPLGAVERDIANAAARDPLVAEWIAELDITYSFSYRGIAGSPTRSQHSWGMAVDFVPTSYDGRHVYWRWSRVYNRNDWDRIPLERRWSPPGGVIEVFERHGFLWGGKWAHFDVIHFEYRPEIILYNRMMSGFGA